MNDLTRRRDRAAKIAAKAENMSDDDLINAARPVVERDGLTISMGGRGMINEPEWEYVFVARKRGLKI